MIEKVYELAKVVSGEGPEYMKIVRKPQYPSGYLIAINLDERKYEGLMAFEGESAAAMDLLYTEQKGNVKGKAPTVNVNITSSKNTEEDLKKGIDRFMRFFNDNELKDVYQVLEENLETIQEDLLSKGEKGFFISVLVEEGGKEFLPNEYERIRNVFIKRNLGEEKAEKGKEGICFLCGQRKPVYSRLNEIFRFSTFDKPGYTVGLNKKGEDILSICNDCFLALSEAKKYIETRLSFSFFGDTLWIIPSGSEKFLERFLRKIEDIEIFSSKGRERFAETERRIERHLSEEELLTFDFLILSISRSEMKILLHIPEVLPTRLREIAETADLLKADLGDRYDPNFGNVFTIFKPPKSQNPGKKDFYSLIKSVYERREYSKDLLLSYMLRWVRSTVFSADSQRLLGTITYTGRMAFSVYTFLMRLGVIKNGGGETVKEGGFFERYEDFFDNEWKKAVFLTGVLTGYLLDYQRESRGSAPFVKKLKGLKMRREDVQALLTEIEAKLLQYKINDKHVKDLFERAARCFVEAGRWSASVDEINFIFTVGMGFYKRFLRRDEDEEE